MLGEMSAGQPLGDDEVRKFARLVFTTVWPLPAYLA